MIFFLLIVVVALLIVLLNRVNVNYNWIKELRNDIVDLQAEITRLRTDKLVKQTEPEKPVEPSVGKPQPQEYIAPAPVKEQPFSTGIYNKQAEQPMPVAASAVPEYVSVYTDAALVTTPPETRQYTPSPEPDVSWSGKWSKDNPDLEKFIGENLVNKIGIAILVLGIGFFVKYAIDQNWIKDIGRICIGLFCGAILLGLAHRLRKNYHSFSSVLVGGGLTIFYFTIALAFRDYHRLTQTSAFIIMVVITIFAVLLSVLYDRIELSIIAAIGGFVTPFLVSNGHDNYVALFTYLCILNAGLIVLAYYKRWRVLNFIGFVFTQAIYLSWIVSRGGGASFPYYGTFVFGCIFYAMFVLMNVIHHVSRGSKLKAFDFIILLSINLCFYGAGIYLLGSGGMADYKGLFTALLGVINLALGWLFFQKSKADKNFIYLLIGITVTYISLAGPVQLSGHYITLFWAAETVVLLWLYQRSFIKLLKVTSLLVTALMLASLFMDWAQVYSLIDGKAVEALPVLLNKGFITGIVSTAAMLAAYLLLCKEADTYYLPGMSNKLVRAFYMTCFIAVLFITGALEVNFQFVSRYPAINMQFVYLQLYIIAFAVVLLAAFERSKATIISVLYTALPFIVFVLYIVNAANIYTIEKMMLSSGNYKLHFIAALSSTVLLLLLAFNTISHIRKNRMAFDSKINAFTWIISIALIVIFSLEARNLFVWFYYNNTADLEYAENLYSKAGLSIVWGLSSFISIWLGLGRKYKPLRIIGLVVFGITVVKLFAYDITNIPPAGKIIAFILLGVVLLVVSFMYQRIKKLIIDDKTNS